MTAGDVPAGGTGFADGPAERRWAKSSQLAAAGGHCQALQELLRLGASCLIGGAEGRWSPAAVQLNATCY